jgi:hypothetical protein
MSLPNCEHMTQVILSERSALILDSALKPQGDIAVSNSQ